MSLESTDLEVLRAVLGWRESGHRATLVTVLATWGSAPRPPGSLLAIRDDGQLAGSVSGGCVEADLIERLRAAWPARPEILRYGGSHEEQHRFRLPCGGMLELLIEPRPDPAVLGALISGLDARLLLRREVDAASGTTRLSPAERGDAFAWDGRILRCIHGPAWRLLLIGAGPISRYLAEMARALDYEIIVCDPRAEYALGWDVAGTTLDTGMPDDVVRARVSDRRCAVLALTHDPKLDDLALLDALISDAFYVGALGSRASNARRRERLRFLGLADDALDRLHGPAGLSIGSRTPPEIAVAILAELTALRHAVHAPLQRPGAPIRHHPNPPPPSLSTLSL